MEVIVERVDEVWILRFPDGRIVHVWSLEDTLDRLGNVPRSGGL